MFCRNCGKEVSDQAVMCISCGVPPKSGQKFCQNCGAETDPIAEVCVTCGVKLAATVMPSKLISVRSVVIPAQVWSIIAWQVYISGWAV